MVIKCQEGKNNREEGEGVTPPPPTQISHKETKKTQLYPLFLEHVLLGKPRGELSMA